MHIFPAKNYEEYLGVTSCCPGWEKDNGSCYLACKEDSRKGLPSTSPISFLSMIHQGGKIYLSLERRGSCVKGVKVHNCFQIYLHCWHLWDSFRIAYGRHERTLGIGVDYWCLSHALLVEEQHITKKVKFFMMKYFLGTQNGSLHGFSKLI